MPSQISDEFDLFTPKDYLQEYYASIGYENDELMQFFTRSYDQLPDNIEIAEIGGGPTLYQLVTAVTKAKNVDFFDYLQVNLDSVEDWLSTESHFHHNWTPYIKLALRYEGLPETSAAVAERIALMRSKITTTGRCNVFLENPIDPLPKKYDVVSSNFVADSVTSSHEQWADAVTNICNLVKPAGHIVMTCLVGASHWKSGDNDFPAIPLSAEEIRNQIEKLGFSVVNDKEIEAEPAEDELHEHGYLGMYFVTAQKNL